MPHYCLPLHSGDRLNLSQCGRRSFLRLPALTWAMNSTAATTTIRMSFMMRDATTSYSNGLLERLDKTSKPDVGNAKIG
ncbi:hypothetical protein L914_07092 [Phytophthora nicotianae]|uniref:Uncharacterized protein n=1 Tax=Phytophthora nicotianae TaxID=4792 RepID=W2NIE5_PHYNI|nr:hypothetical protein L914_07092 [Phytophthora nicotianae]